MAVFSSAPSNEPAATLPAHLFDELARRLHGRRVTEAVDERLHGGIAQKLVNGGKLAEEFGLGGHGCISVLCGRDSFK